MFCTSAACDSRKRGLATKRGSTYSAVIVASTIAAMNT